MRAQSFLALLSLAIWAGCATTRYTDTSRTAMEQMLISNAVDQALDRVEFPQLAGQSVFIEEKYIECVDKAYVLGCVRHRVLAGGARLADKADNADIVLEIRSGGVGTDKVETFYGMPAMAVPGPLPISLPEVKLLGRSTQSGTAKLGIVAYHAKEKKAIGSGGMALARSHDHSWTVLGMGPYFRGEVREEVTSATTGRSLSADVARAAVKRGYRTAEGNAAHVALADERAALLASAKPPAPAANGPAPNAQVADARGQPTGMRPAIAAPPGVPGTVAPGPYPLTPPLQGPLGPLPGAPPNGFFPAMPAPGAMTGAMPTPTLTGF
jgi:hypothetical protein